MGCVWGGLVGCGWVWGCVGVLVGGVGWGGVGWVGVGVWWVCGEGVLNVCVW